MTNSKASFAAAAAVYFVCTVVYFRNACGLLAIRIYRGKESLVGN